MILKKCNKCNTLVEVLVNSTCEDTCLMCCGEEMQELIPNQFDASIEKHKPTYQVNDDEIEITINHAMESDHYIMWIKVLTEEETHTYYFQPGEDPRIIVPYVKGMEIYSYCNMHGLWQTTVE